MCKVQMLRALVKQRLTAAAEEIFVLFERTIAEYEEELSRSREENERQRKILDAVLRPELQLNRAADSGDRCASDPAPVNPNNDQIKEPEDPDVGADPPVVRQRPPRKTRPPAHLAEAPPVLPSGVHTVIVGDKEQQDWSSSVDQEDPEPPHIKEEQEELWSSQEGEQLQGLEEADITTVPVKSEEDEEKPQSSQLHQRHTEHMETEDCGRPGPGQELGAGPTTNSDLGPDSEVELKQPPGPQPGPDDSVDMEFWTETRQHQSGFTYRRNRRVPGSDGSHVAKKAGPGPKTDHRLDAGFYKQTKKPPSDPDHLRPEGSTTDLRALSHTLLPPEKSPSAENAFSCSVCHGTFTDSESLVQHMRIHTRQTQFSCRICGEEFAWRRYLTKHMEVHKIYSCSTCDQGFAWHYQLKYHRCAGRRSSEFHHIEQNREAAGPEPEREPGPGLDPDMTSDPGPGTDEEPGHSSEPETDDSDDWKETIEPQSGVNCLNNERLPVSEERPFSCSECGKRFFLKENLKRHLRTHTGEKPFSCPFCGKRFGLNGNLKRHLRTHTGEKPFNCSVCQKSFAENAYLKKHMKIHRAETS